MINFNQFLVLSDQIIDFFMLKLMDKSQDERSLFLKQDSGYDKTNRGCTWFYILVYFFNNGNE